MERMSDAVSSRCVRKKQKKTANEEGLWLSR
jgi:hypothetical protein